MVKISSNLVYKVGYLMQWKDQLQVSALIHAATLSNCGSFFNYIEVLFLFEFTPKILINFNYSWLYNIALALQL
jgi:hypothetical protein